MRIIEKVQSRVTSFAENHRPALWMLLLLFTAVILVFPAAPVLEYHSIQTLYIFGNLPFFATVFCIWLVILFLLLFSREGESKTDWEKVALVGIASLVFLAFWILLLPYGRGDYMSNATLVRIMTQEGAIPVESRPDIWYVDFPGSHLLVLAFTQVTGLAQFTAINLLLVLNAIVFSILLYLFFARTFKSARIAALGALLVIIGNQVFAGQTFHPAFVSFTLLVAFLLVLNSGRQNIMETGQERILAILLAIAATITYFQASVVLILVLVGLYLVQRFGKARPLGIFIIILPAVIALAWEIYWTIRTFPTMSNLLSETAENIVKGTFLEWLPFLAKQNIGQAFPLWANVIRLFWWFLLFGIGTILGLINLLKLKKLETAQQVITGGLVGALLVAALATMVSTGGERFVHFLYYAAFFTVPILLYYALKLVGRWKQFSLGLLSALLLVLAFPTFLIFNHSVALYAFYPSEISAGKFLERAYDSGKGLLVFNQPGWIWGYYVYDASFRYYFTGTVTLGMDEAELWQKRDNMVDWFESTSREVLFAGQKRRGCLQNLCSASALLTPNGKRQSKDCRARIKFMRMAIFSYMRIS